MKKILPDGLAYSRKQEEDLIKHEAMCKRCGACCGASDGDPCEHLKQDEAGKFFCPIYDNRLGTHKTISGKLFACVPIRELRQNLPSKNCVYFS